MRVARTLMHSFLVVVSQMDQVLDVLVQHKAEKELVMGQLKFPWFVWIFQNQ